MVLLLLLLTAALVAVGRVGVWTVMVVRAVVGNHLLLLLLVMEGLGTTRGLTGQQQQQVGVPRGSRKALCKPANGSVWVQESSSRQLGEAGRHSVRGHVLLLLKVMLMVMVGVMQEVMWQWMMIRRLCSSSKLLTGIRLLLAGQLARREPGGPGDAREVLLLLQLVVVVVVGEQHEGKQMNEQAMPAGA